VCIRGYSEAIPVSGLNPGGNDNTAVCVGSWVDCDYPWPGHGYYCGGGGDLCGVTVVSGESNVGEYEFSGQLACCGDDVNEFIKQGRDGTKACCNSNSDVLFYFGV